MAPPPPLYPNPSFILELGFQGLVAILLSVFALAVRYVAGPSAAKRAGWRMLAWLFLTGALAMTGQLGFDGFPPRVLLLALTGNVLAAWVAFSELGRLMAAQLRFKWLIGFQVFRVAVELLLHRGYNEGLVPWQMSYFGYNFDVLTGISGLLIAMVFAQGHLPRWSLWVWNVCGLGLLLNVVMIAVVSMPTPMRLFHTEPANVWIIHWPFVWLPTFLVPAALLGHLLVFRKLVRER